MIPVRRNTVQRAMILQHLKSVDTHPTAEQIYARIKEDIPAISLATVYRNLNFLADSGEVIRFEFRGKTHFDGDMSSHQHGICRGCGRVFDIFKKSISDYAMKNCRASEFKPFQVNVLFIGMCKNCRKGG
ncbi:transcriptional repressor [Candidatus Woesearchaeota archaeon]|nr:transcriptional repressor [Candidatus Woesearchaeota archaeon]